MADDPLKWIADHIAAGIELCEQGWSLRTAKEAEAWHRRENEWAAEALDGITVWNLKDFRRIDYLHWIDVYPLPSDHPWQNVRINPLNCHVTRIKRLQEVEKEWRAAQARDDMAHRKHWRRSK